MLRLLKLLALLLCALTMGAVSSVEAQPVCPPPLTGDVDGRNGVTPGDAVLALQAYLGNPTLDECGQAQANVLAPSTSGITPADALCIFQSFLGLPWCITTRLLAGVVSKGAVMGNGSSGLGVFTSSSAALFGTALSTEGHTQGVIITGASRFLTDATTSLTINTPGDDGIAARDTSQALLAGTVTITNSVDVGISVLDTSSLTTTGTVQVNGSQSTVSGLIIDRAASMLLGAGSIVTVSGSRTRGVDVFETLRCVPLAC